MWGIGYIVTGLAIVLIGEYVANKTGNGDDGKNDKGTLVGYTMIAALWPVFIITTVIDFVIGWASER